MFPKYQKYQNATNMYTKLQENMQYGHKILTISKKYKNSFHSKALQNVPKLGFF
jgi:hypothetical protein